MVSLMSILDRFPKLTPEQRNLLARRRIERALRAISFDAGQRYDIWFAIGYLGYNLSPYRRKGRG